MTWQFLHLFYIGGRSVEISITLGEKGGFGRFTP